MSTSGTYTFSVDRDSIIKRALRLVGVVAQGEEPTTTQVTEAALALNSLVKAWEADGMPLWAIKQSSITLQAGKADYTIGIGSEVNLAKPLKVFQAFNHVISSSIDIPMRILTREEYNILGNKTIPGNPIQLFYEPLNTTGVLHVFPVPTSVEAAANTVTIVYQRPFEDFNTSTDTPDFPQEWFDAVVYGLASRLAGEYQISTESRKMLKMEAQELKQNALNFGLEEGSLYFQRDSRSW